MIVATQVEGFGDFVKRVAGPVAGLGGGALVGGVLGFAVCGPACAVAGAAAGGAAGGTGGALYTAGKAGVGKGGSSVTYGSPSPEQIEAVRAATGVLEKEKAADKFPWGPVAFAAGGVGVLLVATVIVKRRRKARGAARARSRR